MEEVLRIAVLLVVVPVEALLDMVDRELLSPLQVGKADKGLWFVREGREWVNRGAHRDLQYPWVDWAVKGVETTATNAQEHKFATLPGIA